jgi:methylated-DNA-[protein]-cysteine S-methyltransferase
MKPSLNAYEVLISAPFGWVGIRTRDGLISEITLIPPTLAVQAKTAEIMRPVTTQIEAYLRTPKTKLNFKCLSLGTPYQQKVWQAISQIPCGETRTYTELAQQIGSGPRAVANACGANPLPLLVPCHRVVAKNGLGGFMQGFDGGLEIKKWLLAHESK